MPSEPLKQVLDIATEILITALHSIIGYRSCVYGEQYRGVERIEIVKYEYISPKGRAYPYCLFVDSDNDSDGWGWEE